jgi:broad specificity phosphatase PhoE
MKLTFIRHSKSFVEVEKPIVLWGLSGEGVTKAHELSQQDVIKQLNIIYSSLQTKAIETMLYLAKPNVIPMRTNNGIGEVTSFTNKFYTGSKYTEQIEQYYAQKLDRIAHGETITEALSRFETALEQIVTENQSVSNIGIVTHGYILSFFTGKYSSLKPYDVHRSIQQPDVAEFDWESKSFIRLWGS